MSGRRRPGQDNSDDQARRGRDRLRGPACALGLCRALSQGQAAGGVDAACRRPRDARLGGAEAERRAAHELPLGIGGGRGRSRALLDHRHRSRHRLARLRQHRRGQPPAAGRPGRLRGREAPHPAVAARVACPIAHRPAARPAADRGRRHRLHGLRHRAVGRAPAQPEAGCARRAGQHLRAPDCHGGVRRGQGRDDRGDAILSAAHGRRADRLRCRGGAPARRRCRARRAAAARHHNVRRGAGAAGSRLQHHAR